MIDQLVHALASSLFVDASVTFAFFLGVFFLAIFLASTAVSIGYKMENGKDHNA